MEIVAIGEAVPETAGPAEEPGPLGAQSAEPPAWVAGSPEALAWLQRACGHGADLTLDGLMAQMQALQQTQAQIKKLQDQAANAKRDAKAKIDEKIAQTQEDFRRRSDKLKQAWELTKQALAA